MRLAVTGTPGTGKTTATDLLAERLPGYDVLHLNEHVRANDLHEGHDEERDSLVVDVEAIAADLSLGDDVIVESHLAHRLPVDRVVVLRCHPEEVERRLRDRGERASSVRENAESEALDVVLAEAVEAHGREAVYEVETTDRDPAAVADVIEAVVRGEREPSAGTVDYLEYLR